ncbi:hypothetical protein B0H34DRAFT_802337 [Crassisporium funariophilum]|nr:hypothetical protein B0H34DRAFT_802337 [Crassisporium funariophilum]
MASMQLCLKVTVLRIPKTKTSSEGEDVFWAKQSGLSDPDMALETHLRISNPPDNLHLFAYRHKKGNKMIYQALTKSKFLERVTKAARAANLDPLQGHGIRIGLTLEHLLRGMPFDVMKAKGRWESDAFLVETLSDFGPIYPSCTSSSRIFHKIYYATCSLSYQAPYRWVSRARLEHAGKLPLQSGSTSPLCHPTICVTKSETSKIALRSSTLTDR